jgi:hypothetical protein
MLSVIELSGQAECNNTECLMLSVLMLSSVIQKVFILSIAALIVLRLTVAVMIALSQVSFALCHKAEYSYVECVLLSVTMLSV